MKNQIKKVLSLVLVAVMCLSVFAISASAAEEECAHENKLHAGTVEPTCTGYGYDSYKCADCNKDFVANIVKPLGHNLVQTDEIVPATCFREEGTTWVCDREGCEHSETRGEPTGEQCENFVDADEDEEPDVTFEVIDGKLVGSMICADCGFKHTTDCECGEEHEELVVEADHSHEVEDMTPDLETLERPTCTEKGSIVYECDFCAYSVKVIINEQHQLTDNEKVAAKPHTCDEDGNYEHWICSLCNAYFMMVKAEGEDEETLTQVDADKVIDKAAHDLVKGARKSEEDCTVGVEKKAVYTWVCQADGCDHTEDKEEETLKHNFITDENKSYAATCVKYGFEFKYCTVCGVSESKTIAPFGFLVDKGDADKETAYETAKAALETAKAALEAAKADTATTKEALADAEKAVADAEEALKAAEEAAKADDVYKSLAELKAGVEDYIAKKNDAECGGYASYVYEIYAQCEDDNCICQEAVANDDSVLELVIEYGELKKHPYVEVTPAKAPTCTEKGKKALEECPVCKAAGKDASVYTNPEKNGADIDELGHDWAEEYLYCSETEKFKKICAVCDELIDPTEPELEEYLEEFEAPEGVSHVVVTVTVIDATCVTNGETLTYCACCDKLDETKTIEATGHKYSEEATVIPGSCKEKTLYIYSCVNEGCDGEVEGHNKVVEGELDKTAAGHMAAMEKAGNVADKVIIRKATCTDTELVQYTCTQCNIKYTAVGEKGGDCDVQDRTDPAKCWLEEDGKSGKYCYTCKKWVGETTPIAWEHTMDGEMAAQSACGNEWGWAKFQYCSVCETEERAAEDAARAELEEGEELEYQLSKKSIAAVKETVKVEGHEKDTFKFEGIAATCTTYGVKGFSYCLVCEKAKAEAAIAKAQTSAGKDQKWGSTKIQIAKLTCSGKTKVEETADCIKDGFTLTYCQYCSKAVIKTFDYANGHDWIDEDEDDVLDFNLDDKAEGYLCNKDGYKYYACATEGCTAHNVIEGTVVPAHHVTAKGEAFTSSCLDIEETTECVHCGNVEVTHKYFADVEDGVLPTAKEEGYVATICADCGDTKVQVRADLATLLEKSLAEQELPEGLTITFDASHVIVYVEYTYEDESYGMWVYYAYDVENEEYVEKIDAIIGWEPVDFNEDIVELLEDNEIEIVEDKCVESTYVTEGKVVYVCPCCEAEVEVVLDKLEGIEIEITADSGILAGASIVNGGLVQFTVALNAAELEAAILKAEFYYDPEVLTFVEAKVENIFNVTAEDGTLTVETNAVVGTDTVTAYGDTMGRVNIIVDASYTSNKLPVDVALNGEDIAFVTLTFRVAADAEDYDSIFGLVTELGSVDGDMLVDVNTNAYFAYAQLDEALEAARKAFDAANDLYDELLAAGKDVEAALELIADAEKALDAAEEAYNNWIDANYDIYMELDEIYNKDIVELLNAIPDSTECEYEIAELGNINVDSNINTIDALAIRQMAFTNMDGTIEAGEYFLAFETLDENGDVVVDEDDEIVTVDKEVNYLAEADINMDGVVGLDDYALLNQYLVGNITYEQLVLTSQATAE